jgi:group II intron reverse transcriptase/maturase
VHQACARIRQAAQRDKRLRFTSLYHHITSIDTLREAYYRLKRDARAGSDKVTWQEYGRELESNLADLSARLKRGAYRARPALRTYIPKPDGRQRPLGMLVLEDKLAQTATVMVLNAIYEVDFLGFSYGFRPGRSQHRALDALAVGVEKKDVIWILDADIRGFFDAIDHEWLIKFIEHRIGDQRVIRLIRKWLKAGVLEDGVVSHPEEGTPQGGVVSPLLANIFLHYVLDLWAHHWRTRHAERDMIIVRYADDFVIGFRWKRDADRFLTALHERLRRFKLELHPDKTRLIEFGRWAAHNRAKRGAGKPETFTFLGFTHICGKTKQRGWFQLVRVTERKRMRAKLAVLKHELKVRCNDPVPETGAWLGSVLRGHYQYYGVPLNYHALAQFRHHVRHLWRRALSRRSQKGHVTCRRMRRLAKRWLPEPRLCHPYPNVRLGV